MFNTALTTIRPNLNLVTHKGNQGETAKLYYSYQTLVAVQTPAGVLIWHNAKYSRTTARHLALIKDMHKDDSQSSTLAHQHLSDLAGMSIRMITV